MAAAEKRLSYLGFMHGQRYSVSLHIFVASVSFFPSCRVEHRYHIRCIFDGSPFCCLLNSAVHNYPIIEIICQTEKLKREKK
jgi:hypothetical protein